MLTVHGRQRQHRVSGGQRVGQLGGRPALAFDLPHGHGVPRHGLAGDELAQAVQGAGERLVREDRVLGDLPGLHPLLAPDLREALAVPGGDAGEGHAAADRAEQRGVQPLRHVVDGAQDEDGSRVDGTQPPDTPDRLRGDGVRGVVQDEADEERPVGAGGGDRGELGEDEPRQQPGRLGVRTFGEVDPDPQRQVLQGPQREGPGQRPGGEERRERGAVEQGNPVGEHRTGVPGSALLPGTGLQLAQHGLVAARSECLPQRADRVQVAVEELPERGHPGEVPVHRAVRAEQLGEDRGGPPAVQVGHVADQPLREYARGLVRVGRAAVQVEVVHGRRVADPHDDVVRLVGAELLPCAADGEHRGPSGEGLEGEGLDDRPDQTVGLPGPGRSDRQQRGAEQCGFQGDARAAAGVRVVRVLRAVADADLAGEQVVAGGAPGEVAGTGRVQRGGAAGAQHGLGERRQTVRVRPAHGPRVAQARHVDVVHPAGAHLGGQCLGGIGLSRRAHLRPSLGGFGVRGCGGGLGGGGALPAPGDQLAPAAEAGEGPEHPEGDQGVDHVHHGLALEDLPARDRGHEDQHRPDDRHGVLPDEELGQGPGSGRREGEEGQAPCDDVAPEDLGPVTQASAPVDEQSEEDGLVDGEGVPALDRPGAAERARVPPVARREELQRDEAVGDVAVAPQGPQEQPAERGDQHAHQQ